MDWKEHFKAALALADKRELWCKQAKPCPECSSVQVQLRDWIGDEPEWKCRTCKHKWTGIQEGQCND